MLVTDKNISKTIAIDINESKRSRTPPWPGINLPKSFIPDARLTAENKRSPVTATKAHINPQTAINTYDLI